MPQIEIDGKKVEVAPGATLMDAANQLGIFIPHFCYHKKLSIAANCRMCLVEVEKAPKPLPACATPVTEGMKVRTHSARAVEAQKGVMELLLINHPLDCPICDQGGECQLQDIAVGYGGSASRYAEPKRVVKEKDLGPLVATDMTRCIHCSRCVRFGQEIAGRMELGMAHRGEHTEVMPFLEQQVTSELSGNVIDLCPVGALTSKPFRYSARNWELGRRRGVSPHDGLGANMLLHVKDNRVYRAVPQENEAINECWLADRDRFAYEGLNSEDRLTRPMVRDGDKWIEVDWQKALAQAAGALRVLRETHGGDALAALASPHQTVEELHLLQKLMRALGSEHIEHRLGQAAPGLAGKRAGAAWLGMPIAELSHLQRVLLIGSTVRQEQPLVAHRLRQAVKRGAQVNVVHAADDDLYCRVANKLIDKPSAWVDALAQVAKALQEAGAVLPAELAGQLGSVVVSAAARAIAASLQAGERKAVLLGASAQNHPAAAQLHQLAAAIAEASGAKLGFLLPAANSVGAQLVGAQSDAALPAQAKGYLLLGVEPELDMHDAAQAMQALHGAEFVVALTAYKGEALSYADVVLPITPFSETAGSFVNMEGRLQSFNAAVKPQGEARPAWKVLRVLGNQFGLAGFEQSSVEQVQAEALPQGEAGIACRLDNGIAGVVVQAQGKQAGLERLGEVPIYHLDSIVRRAPALQKTHDAQCSAEASANGRLIARLGLAADGHVRVRQGSGEAVMRLRQDDRLPDDVLRVAAGHPLTAALGARFGQISVERL